MILEIMGVPSDDDLKFLDNEYSKSFIQRQKVRILEKGKQPIDWSKRIPHASKDAIELLKGLLTFNP